MKKVFDIDQCAHVWAQQTQEDGKTPKSSMFFEGDSIYSYGYHFKIARFYTVKNQRIVLKINKSYSNLTSRHCSSVGRALDYAYFSVCNPDNPIESIKELSADLMEKYYNSFSTRSTCDLQEYTKNWEINISEFNRLCDLFNREEDKLEFTDLHKELILEHEALLKQREEFLSTPEQIERKRLVKIQREAKQEKKLREQLKDDIKSFRAGKSPTGDLQNLRPQIMRIKGDQVQTSGGASVPLDEALELLAMIRNKKAIPNETRVGYFTYNGIDENNIVKIGCHKIRLSEAIVILRNYNLGNRVENKGL